MKFIIKYPQKISLASTLSGHWYQVGKKYYPSSTTILNAYPQSLQLTQWIAEKGWNESQRIKSEAGQRGTRVHSAIENLLDKKLLYKDGYDLDEWSRINAFVAWYREYAPEVLATEVLLYSKKYGYAGTADIVCKISGRIMVGDWKTSSAIHDHFALQVASYAQGLQELSGLRVEETFILQLGAKNKNNYRYVIYPEWKEHMKQFLHVKATWEYDNHIDKDFIPPIINLPDSIQL